MVTNRRGVALGILTADCAPILLADREAGVIGAAHAGWKGAKAGVAEARRRRDDPAGRRPGRIVAAIGPVIGPASYEVGPEFRQAFLEDDPGAARFFLTAPAAGRISTCRAMSCARLEMRLGVAQSSRIEADTCAEADRFFSYRRVLPPGRDRTMGGSSRPSRWSERQWPRCEMDASMAARPALWSAASFPAAGSKSMKILAGNSNKPLAEAIAAELGLPLTKAKIQRFADLEVFVEILENVRGEDVFVIQSTSYPGERQSDGAAGHSSTRCAAARPGASPR